MPTDQDPTTKPSAPGEPPPSETDIWSGHWVTERLGVRLHGAQLPRLVGLALRKNPKRAHLLVSTVLGKHIPQRPGVVYDTGRQLGEQVRKALGDTAAAEAVVLGYAETATGLGHSVADGMGAASCLHSTRRAVRGAVPGTGFEEEHSHATGHLLLPEDPAQLAGPGPLVLVDDELSTGRTLRNTLRALHRRWPRRRYAVAVLTDLRSAADQAALRDTAAELGATIDVVALATGSVELPADVLERGAALVAEHEPAPPPRPAPSATPDGGGPPAPRPVVLSWPTGLPDGGRHGFTAAHRARLAAALPRLAAELAAALPQDARRVLVLGTEELMYAPLRLAQALDAAAPDSTYRVYYSTTTRSPVLPVDDPGYAIRSRLTFPAPDGCGEDRFTHNVAGRRWDSVIVITDSAAAGPPLHAPHGLLAQLAEHAGDVRYVVLPSHTPLPRPLRGPDFSSYAPDDVGWLLQDFSRVRLEAPVEEREERIQRGGGHYAESLPVEYQPSDAYQQLFHAALRDSARRIAQAVATVTDTVLAERTRPGTGTTPVLVSLARAGTPVGILMRRWARHAHHLSLPHYTLSIVRGQGIDTTALRWLAAHHDPADVVFVDGWTGKGAITRELADALAPFPGFDPRLAVLADPGGCVSVFGTREDFLIPSACLNSTVSGLISRTVLRADLVGPDDFHGAKFYRELAGADLSQHFLDTVTADFPEATPGPMPDTPERAPTWAGWAAVRRISDAYGIGDVNLVKPGVGETTRVLLRRVPWRILTRRGAGRDLDHIRLLAAQRGVPVEETDDLPYSCVGLIHPRYTRAATGADGRAAHTS